MYNVVIHNLNIFIFVANLLQNYNNVYKQCTDLVYITLGKKCVEEISVGFEPVITDLKKKTVCKHVYHVSR